MNEERYILFDQYLQGELTVDEKDTFEKQLAENPELAEELETFKEMHLQLENKFGKESERQAFEQNLTRISDKYFKKKKTKVVSIQPWYYATAAASIIIIFGLFFFRYDQNPSFKDYNNPESAYFTERGVAEETLKKAEDDFNGKRYAKAIPLFETILKENHSPEIQYFYGISLVEESHYKKAEAVLNELISGNSIFKEKAKWYLALSKLKQRDYKACKEVLLTISEDFENYEDVEQLLEELN
ncbi:tetratricopeptide repeat protein [Flavobacterium hungaricum]|uniref:Tetratricopeptide repeat protein n=1 Tax=Flavobacterium hungaricum TaxID=2082725 RepID=A0ABR9TID4_9FLAO|nr:tetratricopeptide repeat protein [Flavobacterium hungaricum]MBE8725111.1 tetratricopeptide repeat protein [Flavobacterium hungaricum]